MKEMKNVTGSCFEKPKGLNRFRKICHERPIADTV